jgi:hypothetical protein
MGGANVKHARTKKTEDSLTHMVEKFLQPESSSKKRNNQLRACEQLVRNSPPLHPPRPSSTLTFEWLVFAGSPEEAAPRQNLRIQS